MPASNQLVSPGPPATDWTVNGWRFHLLARDNEARKAPDETSDVELLIVASPPTEPKQFAEVTQQTAEMLSAVRRLCGESSQG
jgi:hypothetical protein